MVKLRFAAGATLLALLAVSCCAAAQHKPPVDESLALTKISAFKTVNNAFVKSLLTAVRFGLAIGVGCTAKG